MNNRKYFEINDLLYAFVIVINRHGVSRHHQFARVENISRTGRLKLSLLESIRKNECIVRNGVTYVQVKPNTNVINSVKLIDSNGRQQGLDSIYEKYSSNKNLYDIINTK